MKKEKTIASIFKLLQVRSSPQAILKLKSGENYKIKEVEAKNKKKSLGIVFEDEMQAIKEILINYLSIGNVRKENREKILSHIEILDKEINRNVNNIEKDNENIKEETNDIVINKQQAIFYFKKDTFAFFSYKYNIESIILYLLEMKIKNRDIKAFAKEKQISAITLYSWSQEIKFLRIFFTFYCFELKEIKRYFLPYTLKEINKFNSELKEKIKGCNYISPQIKTEYLELIKKYEEEIINEEIKTKEIANEEITNEKINLSDGLEDFLCEKIKIKINEFLEKEIKQELEGMLLKDELVNRILKRVKK